VPYTIIDLDGDYRVSVNLGGISQGVDVNRLVEGIKTSDARTPEDINKATGRDRALADCEAELEGAREGAVLAAKEKWEAEQANTELQQSVADLEAVLAEIDRRLGASRPDNYED
jgi:hypothetical protein